MNVKICGIRRIEDTEYLNQYPPEYAGFILSEQFWRYIPPEQVAILHEHLDRKIKRVGVFVNPTPEEIFPYVDYLDVIQLHGEETEELIAFLRKETNLEIWKAARVRTPEDIQKAETLPVDKLVLDSYSGIAHGGTGTLAPWELIQQHRPKKPFFLAGGISVDNVIEATEAVHPFGVDVSSSVETDRKKDGGKIKALIQKIRNQESEEFSHE